MQIISFGRWRDFKLLNLYLFIYLSLLWRNECTFKHKQKWVFSLKSPWMKIVFQMHRLSQKKRKIDEFAKTYVQKKNPFARLIYLKCTPISPLHKKWHFALLLISHTLYFNLGIAYLLIHISIADRFLNDAHYLWMTKNFSKQTSMYYYTNSNFLYLSTKNKEHYG